MYDSDHTHFWDVCGDTELKNVASGIRRDIHSVMPDHKEARKRVKSYPKATSDVGFKRFYIFCKNTDVRILK